MPTSSESLRRAASGSAPRLRAMDALRLLAAAAAAVMMFHFTARDHSRWGEDVLPSQVFPMLSDVTRYGYAGVHLFFVISGFVILMSMWGRSVPQFLASRASRLYPAYWAAVLLTATLRWWWPSYESPTAGQVLANLTMVHEPFGVDSIDGVYWTLWVEMQFYLLMLGLLIWGVTARRVLAAAAVVPLIGSVVALLAPEVDARYTFLGWSPLFGAGMALYLIYREGGSRARWGVVALNAALAALGSAVRTAPAIDAVASGGRVVPALLGAVAVGAVALVAAVALVPTLRDLDWRFLTFLGVLTYPLYLTHEYVGWALIETLHPVLGRWLTLLVTVLLCLALAWLLHRLVEQPVHRPMRRWLERRLSRPAQAAEAASEMSAASSSGRVS